MIVVAVTGIAVGASELRQRSQYWSRIATACAHREADALEAIEHPRGCVRLPIEKRRARAAYWREMRLRSERAARYPWLPDEPGPAPPQMIRQRRCVARTLRQLSFGRVILGRAG